MSDEHLKQLGRIVVQSAVVEAAVALVVWTLIGDQQIGRVVTNGENVDRLIDKARAISAVRVEIADPEAHELVNVWLSRARDAYTARGRILHAVWFISEERIQAARITRRQIDLFDTSVDDLEQLANRLKTIHQEAPGVIAALKRTIPNAPFYGDEFPEGRST